MALWWRLPAVWEVGRFACGSCRGFGAFGTFEAWEMAAVNAYKRSHCCGRGVLLSHCCGLVVAFACSMAWQRWKKDRIHGVAKVWAWQRCKKETP